MLKGLNDRSGYRPMQACNFKKIKFFTYAYLLLKILLAGGLNNQLNFILS
ncbi:hypothetical protein NEOC95_000282 [Neochlamydia sp. AcF95]|nr:hypothetical protein [Neochlamydia sp. AcF95]